MNKKHDPIAVILHDLPEGGKVVLAPGPDGRPAARGIVAVLDADESVREIMLRVPRSILLDLAAEQVDSGMLDRSPSRGELDSMMRQMAEGLHGMHDQLLAAFAAELVRRIGGSVDPRTAILDTIRRDMLLRIADCRDARDSDRADVDVAVEEIAALLDDEASRGDLVASRAADAAREAADRIAGCARDPMRFMLRMFRTDLVENGGDPATVREMIETLRTEADAAGLADSVRAALDPEGTMDETRAGEAVDAVADLAIEIARRFGLVGLEGGHQ